LPGAFYFLCVASTTLDMHNNIIYQATGLPYVANGTFTPGAGQVTKNLWFGAGAPPAFDSAPLNADPKLVSIAGTYDLHLLTGSPAIAAGVDLTSGARGLKDLD